MLINIDAILNFKTQTLKKLQTSKIGDGSVFPKFTHAFRRFKLASRQIYF